MQTGNKGRGKNQTPKTQGVLVQTKEETVPEKETKKSGPKKNPNPKKKK